MGLNRRRLPRLEGTDALGVTSPSTTTYSMRTGVPGPACIPGSVVVVGGVWCRLPAGEWTEAP